MDDLPADPDRPLPQRQLSEGDFTCGCCYELMVQPTTLTCGHSFCRLCLAHWYLQSKQTNCPQCRQMWSGIPKINVTLRSLAEKAFEERLKERSNATLTSENAVVLQQFEKAILNNAQRTVFQQRALGLNQQNMGRQLNLLQVKNFCSGIAVAGGVILLIYLVWYWRNSASDLLTNKAVHKWNVDDVSEWLFNLGEWAEPYSVMAKEQKVDGRLMLALDEEHLRSVLNVTKPLHQKAILNSIQNMKEDGVKEPNTLWEYKAKFPGRSLFILYGMKDFPRTLMLYLYIMQYEETFDPFITSLNRKGSPEDDVMLEADDNSTSPGLIDFVPTFTVLPYLVVTKYAYGYMTIHYWISRLVIFNCFLLTILEAMNLRYCFQAGLQGPHIKNFLWIKGKEYLKNLASMVVSVMVWPIVPSFICDFFFYGALYFSPFLNIKRVKQGIEI